MYEAIRRTEYKKMGKTLPRLADDMGLDACMEVQQEDYLPEDQVEPSERDMFPEVHVEQFFSSMWEKTGWTKIISSKRLFCASLNCNSAALPHRRSYIPMR